MSTQAIAFTMYPVSDMERAVAVYGDALGLTKSRLNSDFWFEFEAGGGTFGVGNFKRVGKPGTAQSLALEVADLLAMRSKRPDRGIDASEPHELASCWTSVVRDPDHNQVWPHQVKRT